MQVYQKAVDGARAVSALVRRASFDRDRPLRGRLGASSERVASLISQGFAQSSDRAFASYLRRSRGSSGEVRTQLMMAGVRGHLTTEELRRLAARYGDIDRMLILLIEHLRGPRPR